MNDKIRLIPRSRKDRDELIVKTYDDLLSRHGYTSCGRVAKVLSALGVKTRRGKPVDRQTVWRALRRSEEGMALLMVTKERIGRC